MPSQTDISNALTIAELKVANLVYNNLVAAENGFREVKKGEIRQAYRTINAVFHQYVIGDYTSPGLIHAYDCLQNFIGTDTDNPINPNYQSRTTIVIETGGGTADILVLNKLDTDLIYDSVSQVYYLPYLNNDGSQITTGQFPYFVSSNGVSFPFQFDFNSSPPRIYSFGDNMPVKVIEVKAV
jgi:hypothetical protein